MPTAAEELAAHSQVAPVVSANISPWRQVLEPTVIKRFDGLMKRGPGVPGVPGAPEAPGVKAESEPRHLKRNTDKQDFEKQVLASPCDVLVPEECPHRFHGRFFAASASPHCRYDEVLRGEFARHCSFGAAT